MESSCPLLTAIKFSLATVREATSAGNEVIMGRKADRAGEREHLILAPNKEIVCHSSLISETNQV